MERTTPVTDVGCVCCGRSTTERWMVAENGHGRFPILRCRTCHAAFVWPRPPDAMLRRYYERIAETDPRCSVAAIAPWVSYVEQDARRLVAGARRHVARGRWLDVASGLGVFAREAARHGFDVECIELSEEHARATERLAPGVTMFKGAFEDFPSRPSVMDVVLMSHVLEHARDPEDWLRRAATLLRQGGLLVVEVPNLQSYLGWPRGRRHHPAIDPPQHLTYFTLKALRRQLRRHGFEPMRVENRCPFRHEWADKVAGRVLRGGAAALLGSVLSPPMRALNATFNRLGVGLNITVYARRADGTA